MFNKFLKGHIRYLALLYVRAILLVLIRFSYIFFERSLFLDEANFLILWWNLNAIFSIWFAQIIESIYVNIWNPVWIQFGLLFYEIRQIARVHFQFFWADLTIMIIMISCILCCDFSITCVECLITLLIVLFNFRFNILLLV